jgi:hypothetical protein
MLSDMLESSESVKLYILIDLQFKWIIDRSIKPCYFTGVCEV